MSKRKPSRLQNVDGILVTLQGKVGQVVQRLIEYVDLIEIEAGTIESDIANQITYIG